MDFNDDSFARLAGGAVKLACPFADEVTTYSGTGFVTMDSGQVFRFEVREVTAEEASAEAAAWPAEATPAGRPAPADRLSADLTMSDGRTVHVPVVPPAGPASAGRIKIVIPYPPSAMPGLVVGAAVTNEELGVIFRSGFPYTHAEAGDTLSVEFGEESLDAEAVARVFGEWP